MIQARTIENAVHLTAARYHWRHNRTGRALRQPANDNTSGYFARMAEALVRGDD